MMLSFKMALRSIGSNKLRSVLTMLGIIIGVMALVVLVSLVNGATSSVTDAVSGLGTSMITVSISDDKGRPLDLETVNSWMEEPGIGLVAPYTTTSLTVSADLSLLELIERKAIFSDNITASPPRSVRPECGWSAVPAWPHRHRG